MVLAIAMAVRFAIVGVAERFRVAPIPCIRVPVPASVARLAMVLFVNVPGLVTVEVPVTVSVAILLLRLPFTAICAKLMLAMVPLISLVAPEKE